jgi:hypothetical protein
VKEKGEEESYGKRVKSREKRESKSKRRREEFTLGRLLLELEPSID